jgi:hypothetical protein
VFGIIIPFAVIAIILRMAITRIRDAIEPNSGTVTLSFLIGVLSKLSLVDVVMLVTGAIVKFMILD